MELEQILQLLLLLLIQLINVLDQKNNFIDLQVVHKLVDKKIVVVVINDINEEFNSFYLVLQNQDIKSVYFFDKKIKQKLDLCVFLLCFVLFECKSMRIFSFFSINLFVGFVCFTNKGEKNNILINIYNNNPEMYLK